VRGFTGEELSKGQRRERGERKWERWGEKREARGIEKTALLYTLRAPSTSDEENGSSGSQAVCSLARATIARFLAASIAVDGADAEAALPPPLSSTAYCCWDMRG
jgi:hypothetical protein